jgi:hypothetical protein
MPRAATTSDTFNAIAEPRRRDILEYLAPRERLFPDGYREALSQGKPLLFDRLRRRAERT